MTIANDELLGAFELHSVERIRAAIDGGLGVRVPFLDHQQASADMRHK